MIRLRTGGESLSQKLIELTEKHDNIAFAVAWANHKNNAYEALLRNKEKISHAVIGTHFYQTHPDVLKNFIDCNEVRFVLQPQGIFHPKAYLFWSKNNWDILVGSANLTSGALGENKELMLYLSGDTPSDVRMDLQCQIKEYWYELGKVVTAQSESTYRKLWKRRQPNLKRVSGPSATNSQSQVPSSLWQPLSKLEVKEGSHKNPSDPPVKVRFPDACVKRTESPKRQKLSWRGLIFQVTCWLINNNHLTPDRCPIYEGPQSRYALVSTKPSDLGGPEDGKMQVKWCHFQGNFSSSRTIGVTQTIIKRAGQDPAQFKVRFS